MDYAGAGARSSGSTRFLAFCGEPALLRQWLLSLVPDADAPERLNRILDCGELVIYASPETPFARLTENKGILLGDPVERARRQEAAGLPSMAEAVYAAICGDPGCEPPLGGYAAFLRARDGVTVLRGPSGAIAVHHFEAGDIVAFFSHSGLGRQLGPRSSDGPISLGPEQPGICELEPGETRRVDTSI